MSIFLIIILTLCLPVFSQTTPIGSRENPIPIGTAANVGNWQVKVLDVTPYANPQISKENPYNPPPKEGHQYFMIKLEAKNNGSNEDKFFPGNINVVGVSAVAYDKHPWVVVPDSLPNSDVFPGGIISGNTVLEVKPSDIDSLVMYYNLVKPYVFFSLKK